MTKILVLAVLLCVPLALDAQIPVPEYGCYHSAFTGSENHEQFVSLAKKNIAIEMFYTAWNKSKVPDFPTVRFTAIAAAGSVPHLTWEPSITGTPFPLTSILNGSFDQYIIGYAVQAKNWKKPFFLRLGHEMNGNWYAWDGPTNGGKTTNGYGDPNLADGPERYKDAYRHVHHLFDSVGVTNAVWIWCPNNGNTPDESWNKPDAYYPGDDVVDWVGLDGYNWGSMETWSSWKSFFDTFNGLYTACEVYKKPMMVAEFASTELGGQKGDWISMTYLMIRARFPKIKAVTWFHINKETDWRINSSIPSLTAYQNAIADPYFLDAVPAVSAAANEEVRGPAQFRVEPAYPNPFNGEVSIRYGVPAAGDVAISVANMLGQTVYSETAAARSGTNQFYWNGMTARGAAAVSGMYVVSFTYRQSQCVQKIIYQK